MSAPIDIQPEKLLSLLEEVGAKRALTDSETDLIEEIVSRAEPDEFQWNDRMDDRLRDANLRKGGISRFADRHGISRGAAYARAFRLREACKVQSQAQDS